ncbi:MAG: histidine--tRNA ligase, partial [Desulfobacterales bacterium]
PVQKYFTIGPMFRRERPQKGRYRQFYQINAEIFGVDSPLVDVELIFLMVTLFSRLSVSDVEVHINSLGCPECRPKFKTVLSDFLTSSTGNLCSDCVRRKDRNPLRVLDCKVPACREAIAHAPSILDYLCPACRRHFETVKTALEAINVPFIIDKRLVRGLDYYTRTTFEIQTGSLGAQSAVAGGGRYDALVKALGGPDTPATGFAIGLDRLAEITGLNRDDFIKTPHIYLAALGERSLSLAFEWKSALCLEGIKTEMDFGDKSLKSQMKRADRLGATHVLIVGDNEIKQGSVILRNMTTKEQVSIPIEHVVENIKANLGASPQLE